MSTSLLLRCVAVASLLAVAATAAPNRTTSGYAYTCVGHCATDFVPNASVPLVPGWVFMGGGADVPSAFAQHVNWSAGGDFLVLRTYGDGAYNAWVYYTIGGAHSAATIVMNDRNASSDPFVLQRVREAEAIWLAGGDQWSYYQTWKGTPLGDLLLRKRGVVPMGGTSAGCMSLGHHIFDAEYGTVTSDGALRDPMARDSAKALRPGYINASRTAGVIFDTHFVVRNRFGRLFSWAAVLQRRHNATVYAVGIDQGVALAMWPNGTATTLGWPGYWQPAFVIAFDRPALGSLYESLSTPKIHVQRLDSKTADTYDFATMRGGRPENAYEVSAWNGRLEPSDPYTPPKHHE